MEIEIIMISGKIFKVIFDEEISVPEIMNSAFKNNGFIILEDLCLNVDDLSSIEVVEEEELDS